MSSAKAPIASRMKRSSIGNMLLSAAYFARNAAPRNRMAIPMRAIQLPPLNQAMKPSIALSNAEGSCGGALASGGSG
jgi:hypothetical protein